MNLPIPIKLQSICFRVYDKDKKNKIPRCSTENEIRKWSLIEAKADAP